MELKQTKAGRERKHVHPPDWCVKVVHARVCWKDIRPLAGIVEIPVLRADGTILTNLGYDPQTGLLFEPAGDMPTIPDAPTLVDAKQALATLLDIVSAFPFAKPEHKASWVASVLTPIARHAFSGPSPLFLVDANVAGSGKGLLIDCTALTITGRRMSVMSQPRDDNESRKRITALVLFGDQLILIDNIASASLDAALTGTVWKDRILGRSEIVEMPLRATWYATGNNVALLADTSRRTCHIRLNSPLENPEERTGFKYSDLRGHVREHRTDLLGAAITVLRAWFVAGKPDMELKPWGSFEEWSDVMRNAVVWAGLSDPGETREELQDATDNEAAALRALIAGWAELDPRREGLTASRALELMDRHPLDYEIVRTVIKERFSGKDGKWPTAQSLGMRLHHIRERIVGVSSWTARL